MLDNYIKNANDNDQDPNSFKQSNFGNIAKENQNSENDTKNTFANFFSSNNNPNQQQVIDNLVSNEIFQVDNKKDKNGIEVSLQQQENVILEQNIENMQQQEEQSKPNDGASLDPQNLLNENEFYTASNFESSREILDVKQELKVEIDKQLIEEPKIGMEDEFNNILQGDTEVLVGDVVIDKKTETVMEVQQQDLVIEKPTNSVLKNTDLLQENTDLDQSKNKVEEQNTENLENNLSEINKEQQGNIASNIDIFNDMGFTSENNLTENQKTQDAPSSETKVVTDIDIFSDLEQISQKDIDANQLTTEQTTSNDTKKENQTILLMDNIDLF